MENHKQEDYVEKMFLDSLEELKREFHTSAPLIDSIKFRRNDWFDAPACVDEKRRGLYNPKVFIETGMDKKADIKFVAFHEIMHILLNHVARYKILKEKYPSKKHDFWWMNIAADAHINENLANYFNYMPSDCVTFDTVTKLTGIKRDKLKDMSSEEIYLKLLEKASENDGQGQPDDGSGSNDGKGDMPKRPQNNPNLEGDGDESSRGSGQPQNSQSQIPTSGSLAKINEEFGDSSDDSDSPDDGIFDDSLESGMDASTSSGTKDYYVIEKIVTKTLNWRAILKKFSAMASGKNEVHRSWRRPNKRYLDTHPFSKGRVRAKTQKVLLSLDCSGSIEVDDVSKACALVKQLFESTNVEIDYCYFDTECTKPTRLSNIKQIYDTYECGGGTSLYAALEHAEEYKGIVVVGDMCFSLDVADAKTAIDPGKTLFINIGEERFAEPLERYLVRGGFSKTVVKDMFIMA